MAVRPTAESDAVSTRATANSIAVGPVRTCIGCRTRASATDLLRVCAVQSSPGLGTVFLDGQASRWSVRPDPSRRVPGRGAWLHPGVECFRLAQRRKSFGRALRVPEPVDVGELEEFLGEVVKVR